MIKKVTALFQRDGLKAQAMRGALVSVMMSGGEHILRFASNLVLTRLLFPEAFGLMAMVQVILLGIQSVTTFGLRAAVVQNPRGEEPVFLNTAWTFQMLRGVALWLIVCAAAPFVGQLYNQPILAQILPVAGLAIIITGLRTTKILLAQRRMHLGQLSLLELAAQLVGLICMSLLAWQLESVWALVLGMLVQPSVAVFLHARYLPGPSNRLQWERESARDIIGLGKYLLISTMATYVIKQSDRAVLGFFISVEMLGVYGIAFALATMPVTLAQKLTSSVVFPLYRMRHPLDAPENQANIFRARRLTSAVVLSFSCLFAFVGPWLVETLYDDLYSLAGPIIVILCMANVPVVVMNNTMHVAVVKGDSLRFMLQNVATAIVQGVMIYITVGWFGIIGAGIAVSAAPLLTYPLLAYFQRRYKNWDFLGDAALILGAYGIIGLAAWIHFDQILLIPN